MVLEMLNTQGGITQIKPYIGIIKIESIMLYDVLLNIQ